LTARLLKVIILSIRVKPEIVFFFFIFLVKVTQLTKKKTVDRKTTKGNNTKYKS